MKQNGKYKKSILGCKYCARKNGFIYITLNRACAQETHVTFLLSWLQVIHSNGFKVCNTDIGKVANPVKKPCVRRDE